MFKIVNKEKLAKDIIKIVIQAPLIAKRASAGQFVVVINDDKGERIPLTLADYDGTKGTITLIFQEVGFSTHKLSTRKKGERIAHILGPLGHPTEVKKLGDVICVGGGIGIAEIFPVARKFKQAGNEVVGIIGVRTKDLLILEDELKNICRQLYITTDDGSYGRKGFVTDILKEVIESSIEQRATSSERLVYAVGPIAMMRAVSDLTRPLKIKTIVSLNPIMVDATGMCGACRLSIAGKTKFACVDGPDFDGHLVDFEELQKRIGQFKEQEKKCVKT